MIACVSSFLLFMSLSSNAFCANILIATDLPSPSHQLWNYALAEALIEKGHNITMLGAFSDKVKSSEKYHPLVVEDILKTIDFNIEEGLSNIDPLTTMKLFIDFSLTICNRSYNTNGFKKLINYPKDFKFDLVIIDMTFGSCFYPLIQRFNYPPTIGVTAFLLPPFLSDTFGNDVHPSYLPMYFLQYTGNMNFFQRVINYVMTRLDSFLKQNYEMQELEKLARQAFGDDVNSMKSFERHISLLLCNLNTAFHPPQPLTPNIIPVGGLHIKPAKQLPKDLQTIMDNAKDGVIFFSLGSNARSDKLRNETKQAFLNAFSKLKQIVLWKFESDFENVPENVIIRKWMPQNDILGHPNLRLFISHGGALSSLESAYHGVPVIGVPLIIDQVLTINSMVERKIALKLDLHDIKSSDVLDDINEILTNPIYSKNMKEISKRMRDQPQTPLDTAVFWAEYAMRHNGTHFLNPKSRDMSLFVSSSTDVVLFLVSVTLLFIYLFVKISKKVALKLISKQKRKEKSL